VRGNPSTATGTLFQHQIKTLPDGFPDVSVSLPVGKKPAWPSRPVVILPCAVQLSQHLIEPAFIAPARQFVDGCEKLFELTVKYDLPSSSGGLFFVLAMPHRTAIEAEDSGAEDHFLVPGSRFTNCTPSLKHEN
jgi:hypothetical protein